MTKIIFKLSDISIYTDKKFNIKFVKSTNESDMKQICIDLHDQLTLVKNEIDKTSDWDNIKKIINTYERIYVPNSDSIAKYKPISRAYFKLWETFYNFPSLNHNLDRQIVSLHLAEGPGGFIEALQNYRKKIYQFNDMVYATTLSPSENRIPGWKGKVQNLENINLFYGDLSEDNYYKRVESMMNYKKADFITADGAFDCSNDFNKQERTSSKLIFSEVLIALSNQRLGGSFVIKIFDIFDMLTVKIVYFLTQYYENIYITKPLTSREGNSEKYIVADGFKGIDKVDIVKLNNILFLWNNLGENYNIIDIFDFELSPEFLTEITDINKFLINKQITSLNRGIKIINNGIDSNKLKIIESRQKQMAIKWCNTYELRYNKNIISK